MNIVIKKRRYKDKVYEYPQLVHSIRTGKKVSHKVIANLNGMSKEQIEALDKALKAAKANELTFNSIEDLKVVENISFGAWFLANELAKQTGLLNILKKYSWGKYILLIIYSKFIEPTSKLGILDLIEGTAAKEILGINKEIKYHKLLQSMDSLLKHQNIIEEKLFKLRLNQNDKDDNEGSENDSNNTLILYDVTSSYVEGEHQDLSDYGYNRDRKNGHKQIVIGLACDKQGFPITIEAFEGNTADTSTVSSQISKLKERFKLKEVLFVGDRGMIKGPQKKELKENSYEYLTVIAAPQIKKLISQDAIQMQLFDEKLEEVIIEDKRYILRRNPKRAQEIQSNRKERIAKALEKIQKINGMKKELADEERYHRATAIITKYNLKDIITFEIKENKINVSKNDDKLKDIEELDGCYVMETNNTVETKEKLHSYYKQLGEVENAFKCIKTQHLELRPIFHRNEDRIRAHVFITMLSYILLHQLKINTAGRDYSLSSIIEQFKGLSASIIGVGEAICQKIPEKLTSIQKDVLNRCKFKIQLPSLVGENFST
jgi:transposase